ncbi:hypothetical protein PMAC_002424 [Pneumocystis sp. 'macacae']|nr:hypothetical protein PMAC_002424 [Pneumocystis sp. 'macacae']
MHCVRAGMTGAHRMETFEGILQGLWQARPPGVSGSKVQRLTQIAVQNVKDSGKMAMLLYKHFKKTPGTHKLGVLYVLDSVARAYQDLSRGDTDIPEDGTFAGGLQQLTQLLESLMNDMMLYAPVEHREKVLKLVNIWEKAATFPAGLLLRLRTAHFSEELLSTPQIGLGDTLSASSGAHITLTASSGSIGSVTGQTEPAASQVTQTGSFPGASGDIGTSTGPAVPAVLQALALMAQQAQKGQQMLQQVPLQTLGINDTSRVSRNLSSFSDISMTQDSVGSLSTTSGASLSSADPRTNAYFSVSSAQTLDSHAPTPTGSVSFPQQSPDVLQAQQMALLQLLTQKGVSAAQIQSIIQNIQSQPSSETLPTLPVFNSTQTMLGSTQSALHTLQSLDTTQRAADTSSVFQHSTILQNSVSTHHSSTLTQHGGISVQRSGVTNTQGNVSGGISSGLSPDVHISGRPQSLRRKDSREPLSRSSRPSEDRGRPKSALRQPNERSASPPSARMYPVTAVSRSVHAGSYDRTLVDNTSSSSEPSHASTQPSNSLKYYIRDSSVPEDSIKVLSRTLFIGGVSQSISQEDLRRMFSPYGDIQSCIVNHTARHAFIKMYRRKDAEAARAGMEMFVHDDTIIRTKWGVGFGPRDCSNYTTGVSMIPIKRLTEADRRWCIFAEWGGTGGQPLEGGFVMEEPDIEIGTVVNSKVVGRRQSSGRGEHKKNNTNQKQQNSHPIQENTSKPPSTLVSPWVGAIQENTAYKTLQ